MNEVLNIDSNMRPPTAYYASSVSPLKYINNKWMNTQKFSKTMRGARMSHSLPWNERHHISPSAFNDKNYTYYKQHFGKPFKNK